MSKTLKLETLRKYEVAGVNTVHVIKSPCECQNNLESFKQAVGYFHLDDYPVTIDSLIVENSEKRTIEIGDEIGLIVRIVGPRDCEREIIHYDTGKKVTYNELKMFCNRVRDIMECQRDNGAYITCSDIAELVFKMGLYAPKPKPLTEALKDIL